MGCLAQEICFYSPQRKRLVNFSKASAPFLGHNHPPIQCVFGWLLPRGGLKRAGHEADHSPISNAEIWSELSCTYIPPFLHVVYRKNFILTESKDTMLQKYRAMKANSNWDVGQIMKFRTS